MSGIGSVSGEGIFETCADERGVSVTVADKLAIYPVDETHCTPLVRCRDCAKTDTLEDGTLVCKRFGCFHHSTPADGYCHEAVRKDES